VAGGQRHCCRAERAGEDKGDEESFHDARPSRL
jgi:hypothetical protein